MRGIKTLVGTASSPRGASVTWYLLRDLGCIVLKFLLKLPIYHSIEDLSVVYFPLISIGMPQYRPIRHGVVFMYVYSLEKKNGVSIVANYNAGERRAFQVPGQALF